MGEEEKGEKGMEEKEREREKNVETVPATPFLRKNGSSRTITR